MPTVSLNKRQTGFSLIEIMVVITVMALISVMAWQGIDSMQRSQERLTERADDQDQVLRLMQQFERDWAWRTSVELAQDASWYQLAENQRKDLVSLLPASVVLDAAPVAGAIEWVRAAPAAPGQWLRVRWWLHGQTLYRSAGASTAQYPLSPVDTTQAVVVMEGVRSFQVRAWQPGKGWRELPHSGSVKQSATGIELRFSLQTNAEQVLSYRRVLSLR